MEGKASAKVAAVAVLIGGFLALMAAIDNREMGTGVLFLDNRSTGHGAKVEALPRAIIGSALAVSQRLQAELGALLLGIFYSGGPRIAMTMIGKRCVGITEAILS